MFEVTIKVTVFEDDKEEAKLSALEYLKQLDEIKDDEIREMK